ncbi:MAG: hypothetical protein ACYC3W_07015 [Candidatus Nanopelagicales bacterium]
MYLPPTTNFETERNATKRFANAILVFIIIEIAAIIYTAVIGQWHAASGKTFDPQIALNIFLPTIVILWFFAQKANIRSSAPKALVPKSQFDSQPFAIRDRILYCMMTAAMFTFIAITITPETLTQITGKSGRWSGKITGKSIEHGSKGRLDYAFSVTTTSKGISIPKLYVRKYFWDRAAVGDTVNIDGRMSHYGIIENNMKLVRDSKPFQEIIQ